MNLFSLVKSEVSKCHTKRRDRKTYTDLYFRMMCACEIDADMLRGFTEKESIAAVYSRCLKCLLDDYAAGFEDGFRRFMAGITAAQRGRVMSTIPDPPNVLPERDYVAKDWRFEATLWRARCPRAYSYMKRRAAEFAGQNRRFGINLLREELRWFPEGIERYSDEFVFSNCLSPYVARMLIHEDPRLTDLIECRETQW